MVINELVKIVCQSIDDKMKSQTLVRKVKKKCVLNSKMSIDTLDCC